MISRWVSFRNQGLPVAPVLVVVVHALVSLPLSLLARCTTSAITPTVMRAVAIIGRVGPGVAHLGSVCVSLVSLG